MSPGGWALRGESTLWTGRPVRSRITLADAGVALYLAVALAVIAVLGPRWLRWLPDVLKIIFVMTWGVIALQELVMLVHLLVIAPRKRRGTVYEVTNYRVIVTRGPGDVESVYLDQLDEPVVRRCRDGTGDVVLRAGRGGMQDGLIRLFPQNGGLGLAPGNPATVLRAARDAEHARQVIAEAQQRMRNGEIDVFSWSGQLAGLRVPGEITLAADEDVLWTGMPGGIPWWFGGLDVYVTVFALAWLAVAAGMGVLATQAGSAAFLVILVPFALVGGAYPAVGRLVHRRLRIRRSCYVLTSRRLITTWRPLGGGTPVVVYAWLGALLPPVIRGRSVITRLATSADGSSQRIGWWKELTWPATTAVPPVFTALANAQEVAGLIGAAQIATRAPVSS
jgi:hypothetical protein